MQTFGDSGKPQQVAPAFALLNGQGRIVKLWDYKQRKALVLYFLNGNEGALWKRLETDALTYATHGAELLVLARLEQTAITALNLPKLNILADADGAVRAKYLKLITPDSASNSVLAVFVLDRYGAISSFQVANSPEGLPTAQAINEALEFLSYLCNP